MENDNVFTYQYSAKEKCEVEHIRKKYLPQEEDKLEGLRTLDRRVRLAGVIPALCIGVTGCLVFGIGMCFGLDVFAGTDLLTLLFLAIGIAAMLPAYPIYKRARKRAEAELTPEILRLADEILK